MSQFEFNVVLTSKKDFTEDQLKSLNKYGDKLGKAAYKEMYGVDDAVMKFNFGVVEDLKPLPLEPEDEEIFKKLNLGDLTEDEENLINEEETFLGQGLIKTTEEILDGYEKNKVSKVTTKETTIKVEG